MAKLSPIAKIRAQNKAAGQRVKAAQMELAQKSKSCCKWLLEQKDNGVLEKGAVAEKKSAGQKVVKTGRVVKKKVEKEMSAEVVFAQFPDLLEKSAGRAAMSVVKV